MVKKVNKVLQIRPKAPNWQTWTIGAIFSVLLHFYRGMVVGGMKEEVDVEAFRCDLIPLAKLILTINLKYSNIYIHVLNVHKVIGRKL